MINYDLVIVRNGQGDVVMSPEQITLARHALGLTGGAGKSYRNRFYAPYEGPIRAQWEKMARIGFARPGHADGSFCLTREGALLALRPGEQLCHEDFPVQPWPEGDNLLDRMQDEVA